MNIELKAKASKIKVVAFDVDGVMTDGSLTFLEDGREIKTFNAKDGQGIVMLNKLGFITAIITARENGTVRERFKMLGMTKLFEGQKNKAVALEQLVSEFCVTYDEVAYMGDDLPDLCVINKVGMSWAPSDAAYEVLEKVDCISTKSGGKGAVREMCDFIIANKKAE